MDVRRKVRVKDELSGDEEKDGAYRWSADVVSDFTRDTQEAKDRVREAVVEMANAARLTHTTAVRTTSFRTGGGLQATDVSGHDCSRTPVVVSSVKTPRYAGRSDWESFLAQFELLAQAKGWSVEKKALQLALSLTVERENV